MREYVDVSCTWVTGTWKHRANVYRYLKDVPLLQGLCNNFFLVEICSRGEEKTPENGEKNGGHGPSSAVKDPRKSALSRRGAVFLDRTLILFIFLCTYGLIIGRRISSVIFGIFRWLSKKLGSSPSQKSALFTKMLCNIFWNKSVVDVLNYGPSDESQKKVGNGLRFHSIT